MNENYTYPAVLDYSEKGFINISFPDFDNIMTSVELGEDYIIAAQDLLTLVLLDIEDENKIPPNSRVEELELLENQKLIYINIWMPYHRSETKVEYVKKTLTIPKWLDILAKNNNVNFSAVLVSALKKKLYLSD